MRLCLIISCLSLFLLSSCGEPQNASLGSSRGEVQIQIKASKVPFDPWEVVMSAKGYSFDEKLLFQIYSETLDSNTVHFNWKGDDECMVVFKQQDDTERYFKVELSPKKVHMVEIGGSTPSLF